MYEPIPTRTIVALYAIFLVLVAVVGWQIWYIWFDYVPHHPHELATWLLGIALALAYCLLSLRDARNKTAWSTVFIFAGAAALWWFSGHPLHNVGLNVVSALYMTYGLVLTGFSVSFTVKLVNMVANRR